jgi:hypothetical protein
MHITKKKFLSAAQSSGRIKIFCAQQQQVCAAVKKNRGNVAPDNPQFIHSYAL